MTFDPFTNRIPFGLLTTKEQKALKAAGPWEFANPSQGPDFMVIAKPMWFPDFVYRRVAPPKTGISIPKTLLAHLPPWVKWFAQDKDGTVWGHEKKPARLNSVWTVQDGNFMRLTRFIGVEPGICDWKDSPVSREELEGRE